METILRPVNEADLPGLIALARQIAGGMTTLPPDPDFLARRIHQSQRAFYPAVDRPGGEHYLFVLEDVAHRRIVGTSGLISRVGGFDPFFTYEVREEKFAYPPLGIAHTMDVLHLQERHDGPAEVCSLFLEPDFRRDGQGRLLSLGRFLFLRRFPERFAETVIAELRGYLDPAGRSPFWEAVAAPFFQKDYNSADILSGLGEKSFISALMPRHPLYVTLLPPEAQAVIGQVHHDTRPALRLLEKEGFSRTREVDIFDAGPVVAAPRDEIETVKAAQTLPVAVLPTADAGHALPHMVSNRQLDFRVGRVMALVRDGQVLLPEKTFTPLRLTSDDAVDVLPVRR